MSASLDAAVQFAIDQVTRARADIRALVQGSGEAALFRLGIISGANNGVYTVGLLAADGNVAESLPGIRSWGGAVFAPGDRVLVGWIGDRPIPIILGSGGGGGSAVYVVTGGLGFAS